MGLKIPYQQTLIDATFSSSDLNLLKEVIASDVRFYNLSTFHHSFFYDLTAKWLGIVMAFFLGKMS